MRWNTDQVAIKAKAAGDPILSTGIVAVSAFENAPGLIDVEAQFLIAKLIKDRFRGGRAEPNLVLFPVL